MGHLRTNAAQQTLVLSQPLIAIVSLASTGDDWRESRILEDEAVRRGLLSQRVDFGR
jgi:hypothetical protein